MTRKIRTGYLPHQGVRPGQVWTGRGSVLGRVIRVTSVDEWGQVSYQVVSGSRMRSGRIHRSSLKRSYSLSDRSQADNGEFISSLEAQAIASLRRLAANWPPGLKLVILNDQLAVLHEKAPVREGSVLATMKGFPCE